MVAAILSAPTSPPRLMVARVPAEDALLDATAWRWVPMAGAASPTEGLPAVANALADLETVVLNVQPTTGDATITFEAIVQVGMVHSNDVATHNPNMFWAFQKRLARQVLHAAACRCRCLFATALEDAWRSQCIELMWTHAAAETSACRMSRDCMSRMGEP